MKTNFYKFGQWPQWSLLMLTLLFLACSSEEEQEPVVSSAEGEVQFSLATFSNTGADGGRLAAMEDLEESFLSVFMENANGERFDIIFGDLFSVDGRILTSTRKLQEGTYTVTNLNISNYDYVTTYAVPAAGSPLAPLVEFTLPFEVEVVSGKLNNFSVELVNTENMQPEDFGYQKFGLKLIEAEKFDIAVYKFDKNLDEHVLTRAKLTLRIDGKLVYSRRLSAEINKVFIRKSDLQKDFEMTISKPGFRDDIAIIRPEFLIAYQTELNPGIIHDIYLQPEE